MSLLQWENPETPVCPRTALLARTSPEYTKFTRSVVRRYKYSLINFYFSLITISRIFPCATFFRIRRTSVFASHPSIRCTRSTCNIGCQLVTSAGPYSSIRPCIASVDTFFTHSTCNFVSHRVTSRFSGPYSSIRPLRQRAIFSFVLKVL